MLATGRREIGVGAWGGLGRNSGKRSSGRADSGSKLKSELAQH